MLGFLSVVLVVIVGRMLLSGGATPHPASAGAATVGSSSVSAAASLKTASKSNTPASHSAQITAALQRWADGPVPPLSRNLFNVRIEYFPMDGSRTLQTALADEGFWAKLEKSMAVQTDQKNKQENLKANFKAQAEQLRLESIMTGGPQPKAMVNGELVGEGSVVADFRVLKIEARRIIVEREGIQLEIQTK